MSMVFMRLFVLVAGDKICTLYFYFKDNIVLNIHVKYFKRFGEICNPEEFRILSRSCRQLMTDTFSEQIAAR